MKEEDLYIPVKDFLEKQGFTVHSEVNYCDVAAIKDDDLTIIELKRNLSVELITQGVLRQKLTPNVYIAVPKFKKMKKNDELKNIIYLLRRLELGLLFVDVNYGTVEVAAEPKSFDMAKSRARNKHNIASLVNEFSKRTLDLNKGGSKGKKLVTAYREQVILIACILKRYGEQFPKQIREKGGDQKKTWGILKNNYYNWFESLSNGKYALSEQGIVELDDYKELTEMFSRQISRENKILYLSDLDGTLLNSSACVSKNTADSLNRLIESGVCFSVATARTPATAVDLLKDINIEIPVVMMNGVLVYDLKNKKCLQVNSLSASKASEVVKALNSFDMNFFMYTLNDDNMLTAYYRNTVFPSEELFLRERTGNKNKQFIKVEDYKKCINNVIYFVLLGPNEALSEIYKKLSELKGISCVFYKDNYSGDWILEIFSSKASKKNGMKYLSEFVSAKYTVAFGDNLNDLDFMKAANESYAVANAAEAVLKAASGIILSNDEEGVIKFIEANEGMI